MQYFAWGQAATAMAAHRVSVGFFLYVVTIPCAVSPPLLQEDVVERVPFLLLGMELPPTPLFKDALEKNIIPQVCVL